MRHTKITLHKVISIKQPYATFICAGIKTVENRTWKTNYRGRLLIHASGEKLLLPYIDAMPDCYINEWNQWLEDNPDIKFTDPDNLSPVLKKYKNLTCSAIKHYGLDINKDMPEKMLMREIKKASMKNGAYFLSKAIIGECNLADIIRNSSDPFAFKDCYHWILENPVLYDKPILNINGRLKIWDFKI
jgi:hypothetical protein